MNVNLSTNGLFYSEEASVVVGRGSSGSALNDIGLVMGGTYHSETFSVYPLEGLCYSSNQMDDLLCVNKGQREAMK